MILGDHHIITSMRKMHHLRKPGRKLEAHELPQNQKYIP
jgi:hypothetical protein